MKTHQDKTTTSETSKRLKTFRESLDLSQTEFGAKIGKTQPTITKYESGYFIIPIGVVKQIHKVFGMNLEWFYNGTGGKKDAPEKSNLITEIRTLNENNEVLTNEIKKIKTELRNLHNAFYEFKHTIKAG